MILAELDPKLTWYVSRASGLVTWTLCAAAILWGLLLSSKLIRRRGLPAWLLDLHRYLGTLALVFCAIHVAALIADSYVHFGWREVLIPMASTWRPGAVAWGVVAMYLLVAVQLTSALRSRLPKKVWHTIHLSSFLLFGAGSLHGIRAGTDWTDRFVQYGAVSVIGVVIFAGAVRLTFRPKARPAIRPVEPVVFETPPRFETLPRFETPPRFEVPTEFEAARASKRPKGSLGRVRAMSEPTIEDYYVEQRTFPPSPEFVAGALLSDRSLDDEAGVDLEAFWARQATELISWFTPFHTTLKWELPFAEWFLGGTLNVSYNCLDRHVEAGLGDRVAYHWEGEPGDRRTITYAQLLEEVCQFSNGLRSLGVQRGDRVAIYLPMIPEAVVAMLACTRIGAAHSLVFGGFSPDSLIDRINDAEAVAVITADAGYRRGAPSLLKPNVDAALGSCPTVHSVVVVNRCDTEPAMQDGRDHWYQELLADQPSTCEPEHMNSEDLLYLLYTSGTTAKPKGIMHTTGGYLTQVAFTHKYVFDLHPETDVYWCAADVGWVTGHSYIVYGPLANGATGVMYEGTPDTPREELRVGDTPGGWDKDRLWDIVERYGVTQLYTAPTAIRTFMKWGTEWPERHDLSSLRVLGTVGEPINPEAWMWYHANIGGERCPIVDTWWQTETGAHMISPLPGVTATKPGSACHALPGIGVELVDDEGHVVERGGGYLTLTTPWPSMLRGIWGEPERYRETYWTRFEGRYFAGDGAKLDEDGYLWLLGRVDDVMNVSGHRISTTEVESALVDHPAVAEAAVVGANDPTSGQAIIGYVILRGGNEASDELGEQIRQHVSTKLGPIARPKTVVLVPDLPKTRSGKIMRRLLRDVAEGRALGDTTTLADPAVVAEIHDRAATSPQED